MTVAVELTLVLAYLLLMLSQLLLLSTPQRLGRYQLYCLVTEAHGCEQLAQSCYLVAAQLGIELTSRQRHRTMHWPCIRGLCSVSWCLAEGQWNGDQRRPMGRKAREGLYSTVSTTSFI